MEGHSAPPADAAGAGTTTDPAPPVQANVHSHAVHGNQPVNHEEKEPCVGRVTPRPTFLENLADSRESQFRFHRRKSDDFDSYFVCAGPLSPAALIQY